jgi:YD repeat-containing protein
VSDGRVYTYTWSARGQLLAEWTQGYPVRTFTYDGAGRLVEATVFTLTTRFAYNGLGARVAVEVVGHGTTTYTLDYADGNRILAEESDTGRTLYLHGEDCLGQYADDDSWLYYLNDAEGLVRQGTDAQGEVISAWLFDPDGTVLEGPEGPVSHLVCGGVYDWSTGLIYKDGGYFDPMLGIWLALAPLIVVQSWRGRKKKRGFLWVSLLLLGVCVVGMLTACGGAEPPPPEAVCADVPGLYFWKHEETWVGEKLSVEFRFKIENADEENYVLVNFVKGYMKNLSDDSYILAVMHDETTEINFPTWEIDSVDLDPVYWSNSSNRWNYRRLGNNTYFATDKPGIEEESVSYQMSMDYQMCIFENDDVPGDVNSIGVEELVDRAIKCIDWTVKSTRRDDGTITYP